MARKPVDNFAIDENQLDREWIEHPAAVHRYHLELAAAQRTLQTVKADLEVTRAETDRRIRELSEKKPTESAIANMILTDPAYREAQAAVIDAKHEADVLQAACTALEHKKRALENLVKLHLAGYYGDPKADADDREAVEEMERDAIGLRGKPAGRKRRVAEVEDDDDEW